MSLAVVVIARDEERRLADCLASVSWAEEKIVVVDDRTRDQTSAIAGRFTDRVFLRPFAGYAEQRAWAEAQAASQWILWMDADERAAPALKDDVAEVIAGGLHAAYRVPRYDFMFGGWLRHGGFPQYHVRLYRKGAVSWVGRVHERAVPSGSVGTLRSAVLHYGHERVGGWIEKMSHYTTLEAEELFGRGTRIGLMRAMAEPPLYGGYKYFVQRGFLDGRRGVIYASLLACYRLVRNLKLWDLQRTAGKEPEKQG